MQATIWGARGSIATSGPEFVRFGGNTTCVEVQAEDGSRLILDAGTGLRGLGDQLALEARALGRPVDATLLFSHLHWDHVQGFPFFSPAYAPDTRLTLYGPGEGANSLEEVLDAQMRPPTFPVSLASMPSCKRFHTITSGAELEIGPFRVRARALSHPQGSLGYRIEAGGKTLCFATDTEHPDDGTVDEALLDLAHGVDMLICDAQYTAEEYEGRVGPPRRGWGHSTYVAAVQAAKASRALRLVLTHHDPTHDDDLMLAIERDARSRFGACRAARERLAMRV